MGGKSSKAVVKLDFDVGVKVSMHDFNERYTEANIVILDACIQQYYNTGGGARYITRHFRNLALYFLLPLVRQAFNDDTGSSHASGVEDFLIYRLPFSERELIGLLHLLRMSTTEACYLPMDTRVLIGHALCGVKWRTQHKRGIAEPTAVGVEANAARKYSFGWCTPRYRQHHFNNSFPLSHFVFADLLASRMLALSSTMQSKLDKEMPLPPESPLFGRPRDYALISTAPPSPTEPRSAARTDKRSSRMIPLASGLVKPAKSS